MGSVVVTGASAGVGRAIATAFARQGWSVGLIARGVDRLASARREIESLGSRALELQADVADAGAVMRAADRAEAELGPIEIWVNNAMVTVYSYVADMRPEEFRRVTEVTYLGQVYGTLAALEHMRRRGRGTIVSIGSALAYRSLPIQSAYCAAKAATRGFVDSLRSELIEEGSGIRLTTVHLPAVNTPQFDWARNRLGRRLGPVPPIYQPEAVAEAVLQAVEEAPRELWVGYPTARAIVGQMLVPGYIDRHLAEQGFASQTTGEPADPNRPDNLFDPPPGDPGAHGRFDGTAADRVATLDPTRLRTGALLAAGLAAGALLGRVAATALGRAGAERRIGRRDRA